MLTPLEKTSPPFEKGAPFCPTSFLAYGKGEATLKLLTNEKRGTTHCFLGKATTEKFTIGKLHLSAASRILARNDARPQGPKGIGNNGRTIPPQNTGRAAPCTRLHHHSKMIRRHLEGPRNTRSQANLPLGKRNAREPVCRRSRRVSAFSTGFIPFEGRRQN